MKKIIFILLIILITFQMISFSEEVICSPALIHDPIVPSYYFNFYIVHNDLIKNMLEELIFFKELEAASISEERKEFIIMESKQKKNRDFKKFKKNIEKKITLLEREKTKDYYKRCKIERLKKEIVLMNLEMETYLYENIEILQEIVTDNITIKFEMLGDAPDYQYHFWVGFEQYTNSDTILYLGITYCLLGKFAKSDRYLDIFIRTSINEDQYVVNDFVFYLDAYYYKAFACYNIYMKLKNKESMFEDNIYPSEIYIKESKDALDKIEDILEIPNDEDKIDEVIIKRKKILNRIWSLKEEYLELKKEVEKISETDD